MATAERSSASRYAWRKHAAAMMPALRARADDLCEICGGPVDFDAPARSRRSPSVDHVVPIQHGGHELPPADELRLAHYGCNSARGNRTRHRAPLAPVVSAVELEPDAPPRERSYEPAAFVQAPLFACEIDESGGVAADEIFRRDSSRPQSPNLSIPPASRGRPRIAADTPELVPPRLETPRPGDVTGSYGPEAAGWIRHYLGDELRPWQRYALERILEHRADGSLRWRRVILTVSRQSGKSVAARGICGWRLGASDLFGEPQEVLHIANIRSTAVLIWAPAARVLQANLGALIRRANGQERIELGDGSVWRLASPNLDGGVGNSVSLAFVDEAWRAKREVVDGSLAPTMLERISPQLILCSTAGDDSSTLLQEERDAAIAALSREPEQARTLLLEWSAPPEADPSDREVWRMASPHWTPQRLEALEHAYATSPEVDWRRQYLNQYVIAARSWIAPSQWEAGQLSELEIPPEPAGTIAVNDRDGEPGACGYVLAVLADSGDVLVRGRAFPSRRALWAELETIVAARRGVAVLYPASFEKHVSKLAGRHASKVGTAEQRAGYGPTLAAVVDGRLRHDGDAELTRQMLGATPHTIPDSGTTLSARRSPGPIYLARAAVWAIGSELRPERRAKPMVRGGRS